MCLILFSYQQDSDCPLIIAANRDEFYSRPSDPAGFWEDAPHILAGRDRLCGGTWLGVDRYGRFSTVANYRDPSVDKTNTLSRGMLVSHFLLGDKTAEHYLRDVKQQCHRYNGFNLLAGDKSGFFYLSGPTGELSSLSPGLYGLSNELLNSAWPKVEKGKMQLGRILQSDDPVSCDDILELLSDTTGFSDDSLPDTGIGIKWERILAPIFVRSKNYGTCCSTAVIINGDDDVTFAERTFNEQGQEVQTVTHHLMIDTTDK
ncbi:MAG: NRDE family protein [Gammaproteobacteria bacterium]